jgi:hypothetical protein
MGLLACLSYCILVQVQRRVIDFSTVLQCKKMQKIEFHVQIRTTVNKVEARVKRGDRRDVGRNQAVDINLLVKHKHAQTWISHGCMPEYRRRHV